MYIRDYIVDLQKGEFNFSTDLPKHLDGHYVAPSLLRAGYSFVRERSLWAGVTCLSFSAQICMRLLSKLINWIRFNIWYTQ